VPISALATCISQTKADIERSGVLAPIVGHVGDGNFHLTFVVFPDDIAEMAAATAVHDRLVARALFMDGTCTGEHGIGLGKMGFLETEHGPGVALMRQLKATLDPSGILNPGKVLVQADRGAPG
jgi:D-lactate dehydrogenase (cytochrome)